MNTDHIPIVNRKRPTLILKDLLKEMVTSHIEFTKLKLCISFTHHSYYWSLILSKITLARIIYLLLSLKLSLTNLLLGRVWFISNKETHQKAGYKKKKKNLSNKILPVVSNFLAQYQTLLAVSMVKVLMQQ